MKQAVCFLFLWLTMAGLLAQYLPHRRNSFQPVVAPGGGGGGMPAVKEITTITNGTSWAAGNYSVAVAAGGSDRLLIVTTGFGDETLSTRQTDSVYSSLDGALTKLGEADDGNWVGVSLWYKINPSTGTHTIGITNETGGGVAAQYCFRAIVMTNVNQSSPFGTAGTANGSSTAPSVTITLAATDLGISTVASDSQASLSAATGAAVWTQLNVDADTAYGVSTNAGSGSVAMTWTTAADGWGIVAAPVKAP